MKPISLMITCLVHDGNDFLQKKVTVERKIIYKAF